MTLGCACSRPGQRPGALATQYARARDSDPGPGPCRLGPGPYPGYGCRSGRFRGPGWSESPGWDRPPGGAGDFILAAGDDIDQQALHGDGDVDGARDDREVVLLWGGERKQGGRAKAGRRERGRE